MLPVPPPVVLDTCPTLPTSVLQFSPRVCQSLITTLTPPTAQGLKWTHHRKYKFNVVIPNISGFRLCADGFSDRASPPAPPGIPLQGLHVSPTDITAPRSFIKRQSTVAAMSAPSVINGSSASPVMANQGSFLLLRVCPTLMSCTACLHTGPSLAQPTDLDQPRFLLSLHSSQSLTPRRTGECPH